jgi:hypothetical protein
MVRYIFLILALAFPVLTYADSLPTGIAMYIPSGYTMIDSASGYLNRDRYMDIAVVANYTDSTDPDNNPRSIFVYFGQKDGTYKLISTGSTIIGCPNCGGVMGDPYYPGDGISIYHNRLDIHQSGGSRWRWDHNISFRYVEKYKDLVLVSDIVTTWDSVNPESDNDQVERRNKKQIGKLRFSKYVSPNVNE